MGVIYPPPGPSAVSNDSDGAGEGGTLTIGQITTALGAVTKASADHDSKFTAIESSLEKMAGTVESIQKSVEAQAKAAEASSSAMMNTTTTPDGRTSESEPPYSAALVAALMEATAESDPAKREAAIKKAMGDHGKDMKGGRKGSASSVVSFKDTDEFKQLKATADEYREAVRRPLLDRLASAYKQAGLPEQALTALVASFDAMEPNELRTEVLKADALNAVAGGVPFGSGTEQQHPHVPHGAYGGAAGIAGASLATSHGEAAELGRIAQEIIGGRQAPRSTEQDALNNILTGASGGDAKLAGGGSSPGTADALSLMNTVVTGGRRS